MQTLKFKTTIKCSGCVANVTPALNETAGIGNWTVDTQSPEKILTIQSGKEDETTIVESLEKIGYKAEKIN